MTPRSVLGVLDVLGVLGNTNNKKALTVFSLLLISSRSMLANTKATPIISLDISN
jgi:hypothetical protein